MAFAQFLHFCIKNKYITINMGKPTNVNRILIEKTDGNGRIGKKYKCFPTNKRSK